MSEAPEKILWKHRVRVGPDTIITKHEELEYIRADTAALATTTLRAEIDEYAESDARLRAELERIQDLMGCQEDIDSIEAALNPGE